MRIERIVAARNVKSEIKVGAKAVIQDKTDWAKLKALPDSAIMFTKDAPRTAPDDWTDAIAHRSLPLPAHIRRKAG